jgi:hypothetical protein
MAVGNNLVIHLIFIGTTGRQLKNGMVALKTGHLVTLI